MAGGPPTVSETLHAAANTPFSTYELSGTPSLGSDVSPRESKFPSPAGSLPLFSDLDKEAAHRDPKPLDHKIKGRLPTRIVYALMVFAFVALSIILPVYFTVIKPNHDSDRSVSGQNPNNTDSGTHSIPPAGPTEGGDGSTITTDDGSEFIYNNKFGGFWVSDPNNPFNNNAQPNSWTPPLNQTWKWGKDRIKGVNLGGWFVLEPFISPALYQKYPGSTDEWSISTLMAADAQGGGLDQLEEHYKTFITERDFAAIAGAGLNWVRLPIPFWAIEKWDDEPFLEKICWQYVLRALRWARKYGLRVNLDLHTIPGSQNGYNHSGKKGQVNFMNGVMGYANAQRALEYIRVITEFVSQPQWKDVVIIFGIMNEAYYRAIGEASLSSFYLQAHDMMRNITGFGEGNGPFMSIHDGFQGIASWKDFMRGSDRIALDSHPYFAFGGGPATDPIATGLGLEAGGSWPRAACNRWAVGMNASRSSFGVTYAGEFSNGFNDCGLFLNGVGSSVSYGGDCGYWQDASLWNDTVKAGLKQFAMGSMDALGDWFFWTWKIGNSTAGHVESPLWSYSLGLEGGWIPQDPREASGTCAALGIDGQDFDGAFQPWQTGGVGAGAIPAASTSQFPWPPASISGASAPVTQLPSYTPTGTIVSLPPPTLTATSAKTVDVGGGWFNTKDTVLAPTPMAGCKYPDPWNATDVPVPPQCT
ncbi:glycoside hydrolase family 5 protein [Macrolepiota fuliginosa MF-IS2]|uniref:glucan 1,3-beta-glucosidase n=1 Tax=Macrolepiota fuliginosa MF-IS2 TaxID=1400762 RepID=A0A9P5XFG6_9AGAR|nr:glycoside hydrolase family 5 protein [Macrolepiota fuliginosa MF-IS2]